MRGAASRAAACVAALALAASCAPSTPALELPAFVAQAEPRAAAASSGAAVVLVVLDGVRWQDVLVEANLPNLHARIAEQGALMGERAPMLASGPDFVSLPGYSEIFTGRSAHGCADNGCGRARAPTLFDEASRGAPDDVAVFASWDRIALAASPAPGAFVLSAGRSHEWRAADLRADRAMAAALDLGKDADAFPGEGDFRPDRITASLALRYLETRRPRLLFLGLGEPDEYAHRGDLEGYRRSLREADGTLARLFAILDRMGERGARTTVFVTADHGRGEDWRDHGRDAPSARVWLAAMGGDVRARGSVYSGRAHRLSDIAPTIRELLDLPADAARSSGDPLTELFTAPETRSASRGERP